MNAIDKILAKLPLNHVTIRTTIDSASIIERIEFGIQPTQRKRQRSEYYTFEGSYYGNYFKIQGHLMNPDGSDAFPKGGPYVSVGFVGIPLNIETSPTFYGRVFDKEEGSIISGHFALPFPILSLLLVIILLIGGLIFPVIQIVTHTLVLILLLWSVSSLIEFYTERKAIIDFLKGLLFDVIYEPESYR